MSSDLEYAVQLVAAMRAAGIHPTEDVAAKLVARTGEMIRFGCHGERKSKRNGYAILHLDGRPAGAFGNWATQTKGTWKALGKPSNDFDRLAWNQKRVAKVDAAVLQVRQVAKDAEAMLAKAELAVASHPYLVRKGLPPIGLYQRGSQLLVPMTDIFGKLWNLQRINADGFKAYLRGPRKERIFWSFGLDLAEDNAPHPDQIHIGEGMATMLADYVSEGAPVVAAMDAGSLVACTCAIRARYPKAKIVICADDDAQTADRIGKNPGMSAAEDAAAAVGGWLAKPRRR